MKKNKIFSSSAIVTALLASLCCTGPLILVGLGIGSTAFFAMFSSLRLYLLTFSILLLIPAFYIAYRKRETVCADDSCKVESGGRWNKVVVWLALVSVLFFTSFSLLGIDQPVSYMKDISALNSDIQSVSIKICNMDCEACARGLESQLRNESGILNAEINFKDSTGIVKYYSDKTNPENIKDFLTAEEFPSEIILINSIGGN